MSSPASRVVIRGCSPESLADREVRRNVIAAAHALGERMGVALLDVRAEADSLHLTVEAPPIVATGLAAELRRSTERWHAARYGAPLWHSSD